MGVIYDNVAMDRSQDTFETKCNVTHNPGCISKTFAGTKVKFYLSKDLTDVSTIIITTSELRHLFLPIANHDTQCMHSPPKPTVGLLMHGVSLFVAKIHSSEFHIQQVMLSSYIKT